MDTKIQPSNFFPDGNLSLVPFEDIGNGFCCVVFTRFFLREFGTEIFKKKYDTHDKILNYLEERVNIFSKICWPSLSEQIKFMNCQWYLFIDEEYIDYLSGLLHKFDILSHVKIVSDLESHKNIINNIFDDLVCKNIDNPLVLTMRIDNDDALSYDFFNVFTKVAYTLFRQGMEHGLITFPHGRQYKSSEGMIPYLVNNNHFICSFHSQKIMSLSQTPSSISFNHSNLFKLKDSNIVIVNTDLPMWLEYVHDTNLLNRFSSAMNFGSEQQFLQKRFSISDEHNFENRYNKLFWDHKKFVTASLVQSGAMKPAGFASVYNDCIFGMSIKSVLEIGVHNGLGIKFLRSVLGNKCKIYGIDIKEDCLSATSYGADAIFIGSQDDELFMTSVFKTCKQFDMIIDDGSHRNIHMLKTLNMAFDYLAPGGKYIVEDIFTSYWSKYGGGLRNKNSFIENTKEKIDQMFVEYMGDAYSKHHSIHSEEIPKFDPISNAIDSIRIYSAGIIVFVKK